MNSSKRNTAIGNETSVSASMYLSFDSTLSSSSAYKTLESSDFDLADKENLGENSLNLDQHLNSTLEVDILNKTSPTQTVKRVSQNANQIVPLKALPKNILKEYKAVCSTPSKEELMRSVDLQRGSDAERCLDLGLAFQGIEDDVKRNNDNVNKKSLEKLEITSEQKNDMEQSKPINVLNKVDEPALNQDQQVMNNEKSTSNEEEQEELQCQSKDEITSDKPESMVTKQLDLDSGKSVDNVIILDDNGADDNSKTSASNSIDALSLALEQKLAMLSTTDEDSVIEKKHVAFNIENATVPIPEKTKKNDCEDSTKDKQTIAVQARKSVIPTYKPICKNIDMEMKQTAVRKDRKSVITTQRTIREEIGSQFKNTTVRKVRKSSISVKQIVSEDTDSEIQETIVRKPRKSAIPKPRLVVSAPFKRLSFSNRRSLLSPKILETAKDPIDEIPKLINQMHFLTAPEEQSSAETNSTQISNEIEIKIPLEQEYQRKKTIVQVTAQGAKKAFGYTQRMSFVVKTTLNSPSRKVVRKSAISNTNPTKSFRPSIMPRKSIMPMARTGNENNINRNKPTTSSNILKGKERNLKNEVNDDKVAFPNKKVFNKPEVSFSCNVCHSKFNLKSLLEAHKRSHEVTPVQKMSGNMSSGSSTTSLSSANQCKYCDKKFALVRALHIHLLEKCTKIPPKDKRKLRYTEMEHVEKAQIPHFDFNNGSNAKNTLEKTNSTTGRIKTPNNSLEDKKEGFSKINSGQLVMETPQLVKKQISVQDSNKAFKKKTAHSGIYRTPSKTVPCHLCKLSFKSVLEYTQHAMTVHKSNNESI